MSANLLFRIIGLIVFGIIGWQLGTIWADTPNLNSVSVRYIFPLAAFGALIGALVAPFLTTRPAAWIRKAVRQIPASQLIAGGMGLAAGLIIAALLAVPLWRLPPPFGQVLPFVSAVFFGYLGITVMVLREPDILAFFGGRPATTAGNAKETPVILDTSVIIDGRIADVSQTGFIRGPILVPRFVLNELQYIADSSDPLRRNRGRRGLEMLNRMQKEATVPVSIVDVDAEGTRQVDEKLIRIAKEMNCPIVTNDYNLNRVAGLQGVTILNVNELANAVKPVVLPGEPLRVRIIQEGKEMGQGVAYLDDGTMVVVDNGRRFLNASVDVIVTKVLQTAAGRMIFAQPDGRTE